MVDVGNAVLVEGLEVGGHMGLVGRDLHGVAVLAPAAQHHHDPLPVGAGHFGDVAVDELVLLVHHQVLEVAGGQDAALAAGRTVGATCVCHLISPGLMQHRRCRKLSLRKRRRKGNVINEKTDKVGRMVEHSSGASSSAPGGDIIQCPEALTPTRSNTLGWKFLVSLKILIALVQVCLIKFGAKLCRTVALQEQVWTLLAFPEQCLDHGFDSQRIHELIKCRYSTQYK